MKRKKNRAALGTTMMSKDTIMHYDSDYETSIYEKKTNRAALGTRIISKQTIIH